MQQEQLVVVLALITNDEGKILLARRNEPEDVVIDDKLEFIGGKVEFGEDPEDAIIREVKEESGLNIKVLRLLPKIYSNTRETTPAGDSYQVFLLPYECKIISGEMKKQDKEIKELKYFQIDEINYEDCLPKVKEIISLLASS